MELKVESLKEKLEELLEGRRGVMDAYTAIAGIVGIVLMLYFVPLIISSIQSATGSGLSASMTVAQSYLDNNTKTSINLLSLYPVIAVAGLMIAAFIGVLFFRGGGGGSVDEF